MWFERGIDARRGRFAANAAHLGRILGFIETRVGARAGAKQE